MSPEEIVRMWKTQAEDTASAAPSPVGHIDLSEAQLEQVVGASTEQLLTIGCCSGLTTNTCLCSLYCHPIPNTAINCPSNQYPC